MKKTNILFVCKYNRFRSRIAEAYFKKINKNKNIKVKSAGLIKGSPIDKFQKKIAQTYGIKMFGIRKSLSTKLLKWQNITIIVADNVPKAIFGENKIYGKRTIIWKIKDSQEDDVKKVKKIIEQIIKKVDNLVKQLEKIK